MDEETNSGEGQQLSRAERRKIKRQHMKDERRVERGKDSTRSKMVLVAGIVIAMITVGALGILIFNSGGPAETPTAGNHPSWGPDDALVTVIEFGDYQCPFTRKFQFDAYEKIQDEYGDKVKYVFWPMPTGRHRFDRTTAQAAYCAEEQGKHFEYMELLFQRQGQGTDADIKAFAREVDLDLGAFNECYDSGRYKSTVAGDYSQGTKFGVRITPTFFINDVKVEGEHPFSVYKKYIDLELARLGG